MNKILYDSLFIGLLTMFLYFLYNYISYYYNNDDNIIISCISNCVDNKISKYKRLNNYKYYIYAFIIGIIIHLIIDYIGLNQIYCQKLCYNNGKCELVCKMPLN